MLTTLEAWLDELADRHPPHIIDFGLERMFLAMQMLGIQQPDPNSNKIVTVAGTNGKGSCCMLLAAILNKAGISNGVYVSPHLYDFRERLLIDGEMVAAHDWVEAFDLIDATCGNIQLTFFEWVTLAALHLLNKYSPTIWILEIGLGGRLDAVNALDNQLNLITSIDFDHTDRLGTTLEAIAGEKSGVMRGGITTICGSRLPLLGQIAEKKHARMLQVGRDWKLTQTGQAIEVMCGNWQVQAPLSDGTMPQNLAMALLAAHHLGASVDSNDWLKNYRVPGRQQLLEIGGIQCLIDVSHNASGVAALAARVARDFAEVPAIAVFGCLADKQPPGNLAELFPSVHGWLIPDMIGARGQPADRIIEQLPLRSVQKLSGVTAQQLRTQVGDGLLIAFGSFHIAPIVKTLLEPG